MADASALKRVAFSPGEFAALFGKSQTWGYRQIYAGKVKAVTEYGRILIPAAEVEAILKTAGIYEGMKPKPAKTKAEIQSLAPKLQNAWQTFLAARRKDGSKAKPSLPRPTSKVRWPKQASSGREAVLARLARRERTQKAG
jgi:hypothetical protein